MDLHMEILKTRRAKEYRMKSIRINFLSETKKVRRKWNDIVKVLKENSYQLKILCQAKLSFKTRGEINEYSPS